MEATELFRTYLQLVQLTKAAKLLRDCLQDARGPQIDSANQLIEFINQIATQKLRDDAVDAAGGFPDCEEMHNAVDRLIEAVDAAKVSIVTASITDEHEELLNVAHLKLPVAIGGVEHRLKIIQRDEAYKIASRSISIGEIQRVIPPIPRIQVQLPAVRTRDQSESEVETLTVGEVWRRIENLHVPGTGRSSLPTDFPMFTNDLLAALEISSDTLKKYAEQAGVSPTPPGKNNRRYGADEVRRICRVAMNVARQAATRQNAKVLADRLEGCR